jgi:predicted alpha/beta hydrolase family esterase
MTKQILFIQGGGTGTHDDWDNELVASLQRELGRAYEIRYPRMPNEGDPHYASWRKAIENEIEALDDGAILVGHSIGGTILIRTLADQPPKRRMKAVVLVAAPFVGKGGWPSDDIESMHTLGGQIPSKLAVYLFHGSADETALPFHADLYAKALPQAQLRKLEGRDHQLNNDMREVAAMIRSLENAQPSDQRASAAHSRRASE